MSQRLLLPFKKTVLISAGYKNAKYHSYHKCAHYGLDCGSGNDTRGYDVYACGDGTVISAGLNNGASNKGLGYCVVITYSDVECNDGVIRDLACRMFHFDKINVKSGQKVTSSTKIGEYGNSGVDYNPSPSAPRHLHIEFGTNYSNPTKSIGIAVTSSGAIVQRTVSDISINPSNVWFSNIGQVVRGVTSGWYSNADINLPKITDKKGPKMQKLILPVNKMKVTCGYKNEWYPKTKFNGKYLGEHYGLDFSNDTTMWGSGDGIVISAGEDRCFGKYVVVKYKYAYNHKTGTAQDVVFRYFHMASVSVKSKQRVTKDTKLGIMGSTGTYSSGIHCHLEVDSDTEYWNYTPSLSGNSSVFKAGYRDSRDTTINPIHFLHIKSSAPDNQVLTRNNDGFSTPKDIDVPKIQ